MSAQLWRAVVDLAAVWRPSEYVREYVYGAQRQLVRSRGTGADHIEAQPFYLLTYLPTTTTYSPAAEPPGWREKAVQVADGYTALIEWLRSRLVGYPFPGTPQLALASPWSSLTVSMRVPWLPHARAWQLQNQPRPPVMPFLPDRPAQAEAGANLAAAVASSPAAAQVERSWNALTTNDKRRLYAANVAMDKARYPEPDDVRGDEDFRELAWSDYILDDALHSLPERARAFADTLANADSLLQQAAVLFSQLVMTEEIRQLPHVGYVDQFDGPDHWHTARSDSYIYEPIRVREIIGFDHPYPRGLMLVEGITERLPFEPHPGSVTVRGPILPGSEELAASAVPIQRVFVAPTGARP
jgi:hypothetical protein